MKTILIVRWFDGTVACYIEKSDYSEDEWRDLFKNVGDIISILHADKVSLQYMF